MEVTKSFFVKVDSEDIFNIFFIRTTSVLKHIIPDVERLLNRGDIKVVLVKTDDRFCVKSSGRIKLTPAEIQKIISGEINTNFQFNFEFPQSVALGLIVDDVLKKENISRTADLNTPIRNIKFQETEEIKRSITYIQFDLSIEYDDSSDHK